MEFKEVLCLLIWQVLYFIFFRVVVKFEMSYRGVFVSSTNFYQLPLSSEFLKNVGEGKEDGKLAKENVLGDIFHGFGSPENLMTTGLGNNRA